MDVELTNPTSERIKPRAIIKLAKKVGRLVGLPKGALISIVFLDAVKMREINKEYRSKDEPTDVLSFLLTSPKEVESRRILQSSEPEVRNGTEAPWALRARQAALRTRIKARLGFEKNKFIIPKFVRSVFGEIFLCSEIIRAKASERGVSEEEYQKLLIVHAMLHLKGLEHDGEKEAEEMEHKELEILNKINNL